MSDELDNLQRSTVPLPLGHAWKCKPGNNLFVAERGAASFEIPQNWVIRHDGKETVSLHDLPPPKDSCRIAMTIFHLPPVSGGWSGLPLEKMFEESLTKSPRKKKGQSETPPKPPEIHTHHRPDQEMVWADKGCWPDPENRKPIHCRQIMARARLVQVLITFDVYQQVQEKFEPVWKDLLRTLRVAVPRDLTGRAGN